MGVAMRTIVVGDVQGCLEELRELMKRVKYEKGHDRLILAGDLLDRGPDSVGVVRWAMENCAEAVMGNHEESHLRFCMHEAHVRLDTSYKNPMLPREPGMPHRIVFDSLGNAEWAWLARLPNYIHIDDRWTVVHAGCLPGVAIEQQEPRHLQRLRYVRRATGKMASLGESMSPLTHAYWTELWNGPRSIVYGHHVESTGVAMTTLGPTESLPSQTIMAHEQCFLFAADVVVTLGIDTGCCFGHALTCAVFDDRRSDAIGECSFVETYAVPAHRVYDTRRV